MCVISTPLCIKLKMHCGMPLTMIMPGGFARSLLIFVMTLVISVGLVYITVGGYVYYNYFS